MTDQQYFNTISHYAPNALPTKNLDRLIEEGQLYNRFYAPSLVCMPARAIYLSGLSGFHTGVWMNGQCLIPERRNDFSLQKDNSAFDTFGRLFTRAGYKTAAIGKLHFSPTLAQPLRAFPESRKLWEKLPQRLASWGGPYFGFDYCKVSIGHSFPKVGASAWGHFHAWLNAEADAGNFPDMAERKKNSRLIDASLGSKPLPDKVRRQLLPYPRYWHQESWVARQFSSFLAGLDGNSKFLAFLGLEKPHHPYQLSFETACENADYIQGNGIELSDPQGRFQQASSLIPPGAMKVMDPVFVRYMARLYRLSMLDVDKAVGLVLSALEQEGLLDETMIIFTSDHGDFAGEHGLLRKANYPSNAIFHVPFIVRPAGGGRARTIQTPCSGYDLFPTLMGIAGIDHAHGDRQGCSLFGRDFGNREFVNLYTWTPEELHVTSFDGTTRYSRGLSSGNEDMFDLTDDPFECTNLADAARAQRRLDTARERTRHADELAAGYDCMAHARHWSKY